MTIVTLDLITRALRLIGEIASGDTPTAEQAQDSLNILNEMRDAWQLERLMIHTMDRGVYDLTDGQTAYVFGDLDGTRPVKIDAASLLSNDTERSVDILTREKWIAGQTGVYCDYDWPEATLYVNGAGDGEQLVLYTWSSPAAITDLTTQIVCPPGYAKALRYNLAVELAPEFKAVVDPVVAATAMESKAVIKASNIPVMEMSCDAALVTRQNFNILTDSY
jgi:hypothetical protein